jgi:alcohol dehydrogenase class IV
MYCGKTIKEENVTVDHKVPHSKGGLTEESNLAIACYNCNHEKGDMTATEYIQCKHNQEQEEQVKELIKYFKQLKQEINNENRLKKLNRKNKERYGIQYILEQQEKRMEIARKDSRVKIKKDKYLEHMNNLFNQIQICQ